MILNRLQKTCLVLGLLICVSTACERVETEPEDWYQDNLAWDETDKNGSMAGFFLNNIYNYIPTGFNRVSGDFLDAATDDALPSRNNTTVEYYTNGRISVLNNPDAYWGSSYEGIRNANVFLANVDRVPVPDATKIFWKAEARFMRALLYFELLKRYGGVPLLGDKVFNTGDDLELPRNTYEECVNYIAAECNAVKGTLRSETAISDAEWGKIPRGAAYALKSRLFLYAASPLFNGGGIETDVTKKAFTGFIVPKEGLYDSVLAANTKLNALNYYKFHTGTGTAAYRSVFTAKKNFEIILAKQDVNNFNLETNNAPVGFVSPVLSNGRTSPTQNFVDAFPTSTGAPYTGPKNATQYTGRDPRLEATIFYNGNKWLNRNIETFEGGKDKPNAGAATVQTRTGYYLKKFMADFTSNTSYSNQSHNFPIFRYAEIVLNNAEALNEKNDVAGAVAELVKIRQRAGITAGTNNRYGIPNPITQDALRTLIRNERRVELSFEEHRFWDVRRWKIADQVLVGSVGGLKITKNGTALTYEEVTAANRVFDKKLYHMPIPYSEIVKNPNLVQNEGW